MGVAGVFFSADGAELLVVPVDDHVLALDARTGESLRRYGGHSGFVVSAALSADGRSLVDGSDDDTLRLWSLAGGDRVLRGHAGAVRAVAISGDGRRIVSVGDDRTVRLWRDDLPHEPAALRAFIAAAAAQGGPRAVRRTRISDAASRGLAFHQRRPAREAAV